MPAVTRIEIDSIFAIASGAGRSVAARTKSVPVPNNLASYSTNQVTKASL
jgi:hypothetical protein